MTAVSLHEIAELQVGCAFKSRDFSDDPTSGARLLRGDNIGQGDLRWDGAKHWPESFTDTRYELKVSDLVLAMDRPWVGAGLKYATVTASDLPALLVQRVARLRARPGNDQRYLHYVIGSGPFTAHILAVQTGTAVPHVSGSQIMAFRLKPHSLPEQRAIADVLGALDDKIAANVKLIVTVDELSRVKFEGMLADAEHLPLSSLARFVNGKAFTKGATGTGRVVIRIAELNSGIGGSTVWNDIEVVGDHLARPGDLLFAWSGSLTVHRWFRSEGIVNQHIFKVIPTSVPMWVVNGALHRKLMDFKGIAADKATTMGHIQRRHLDEGVTVPTAAVIAENDHVMSSLWERALAAEVESQKLISMRDALLPLLMSGKIRVNDAERIVAGETEGVV